MSLGFLEHRFCDPLEIVVEFFFVFLRVGSSLTIFIVFIS